MSNIDKTPEEKKASLALTQIDRIIKDRPSLPDEYSRKKSALIIREGLSYLDDPVGIRERLLRTIVGDAILSVEQEVETSVSAEDEVA